MKYGLSDQDMKWLDELLIMPLKKAGAKVWLFGSRARGEHRKYSDIDILYSSPQDSPLASGLIFELKTNLEESRLAYKVDLVEEAELAESYKESVMQDRVEL